MRSTLVGLTNSQSIVVSVFRANRYSAGAAVVQPTRRVLTRQRAQRSSASSTSARNMLRHARRSSSKWFVSPLSECTISRLWYISHCLWGYLWYRQLLYSAVLLQLPLLLTSLRGLTGFWGFRYFWIPQQQHKRLVHCALFQGERDHNLGLHRLLCKKTATEKTWNWKRQTNDGVIDSTHTHLHAHTRTDTHTHAHSVTETAHAIVYALKSQ